MKVTASSKVHPLEDLWVQRQKAQQQEETSYKKWTEMPQDHRTALESILNEALHKMAQDKSWLPYSIEFCEGGVVDINIRIVFSDITEEILKRHEEESREIATAQESTERMLTELERAALAESEGADDGS